MRPHSTYELAKAMDRSVGRVWPRAQSKLFEEPKKLVLHGYASAREDFVGRRPRTVYRITRSGRRALAVWLADPGDGPALEFEGLVKLVFADHGTRDDALATVARARAWAVEMNAGNIDGGEKFAGGDGLYEQRRATTLLFGAFLTDFYALVASWAKRRWAEDSPAIGYRPNGPAKCWSGRAGRSNRHNSSPCGAAPSTERVPIRARLPQIACAAASRSRRKRAGTSVFPPPAYRATFRLADATRDVSNTI